MYKAGPIILRVHVGVMSFFIAFGILGFTICKFAAQPMGTFSRAFMLIYGFCIGDNIFPWLVTIS
jgi:hypothetical protein